MLKDAQVFHNLGFGVHLLKEKSKVPIELGWSKKPRLSFQDIRSKYRKGLNIGVVLGSKSKIENTYLAVIDCDIKGDGSKYQKELNKKLKEIISIDAPTVYSGRGNGSKHIYIRTKEPISPYSYYKSEEKIKVLMPSVPPSGKDKKALSAEDIKKGYRSRPAWEISIMGDGQQVVLPPSIHPDTKKPYKWKDDSAISSANDIPIVDLSHLYKEKNDSKINSTFNVQNKSYVDVNSLPLDPKYKKMIISGEDVEDRSSALYSVVLHALHHDVSVDDIVDVLTNPEYFLGEVSYHHAKTKDKARAAKWVHDQNIVKALKEFSMDDFFNDEIEISLLSEEEKKEQDDQMEVQLDTIGDWRDSLMRNSNDGAPKANHFNIKLIIKKSVKAKNNKIAARNLFSFDDTWLADTPWGSKKGQLVSDDDSVRIKDFLAHKYRLEAGRDKIYDALSAIALENAYHPVRDYLDTLEWDGEERLTSWLKTYLGAKGDDEVLECFGMRTMIGLVKRIYEPGCKFDTVLILEGKQDLGKSSAARILAGDKWFSDSDINIGDKDAVISMGGNWIIELGELAALSRKDSNALKFFISRQSDKIRPHYGRRLVEYPRQSIFIGTTNDKEYLKDPTGNRRYWPVTCKDVSFARLKKVKDQLIAEAKYLYQLGFPSYVDPRLEPELYKKIQREQGLRMEHDEIENDIINFIENISNDHTNNFDPDFFSMSEIFDSGCVNGVRNDMAGQKRIGNILRKMGYYKTTTRKDGKSGKFWVKKGVTP